MISSPLVLPIVLSTLLIAAGSAHAQLYRWTDADGRTVVSDTPPPPQIKHQQIRKAAQPSGKDQANPSAENKDKQAGGQAKTEGKASEGDAATCAQARQNLQALESGAPLTVMNAKGERVPMEDAARVTELNRVKEILRNCKY